MITLMMRYDEITCAMMKLIHSDMKLRRDNTCYDKTIIPYLKRLFVIQGQGQHVPLTILGSTYQIGVFSQLKSFFL